MLLVLNAEVLNSALCHLKFTFHFENIALGLDSVSGKILTCISDITSDTSLALLEDFERPSVLLLLRG